MICDVLMMFYLWGGKEVIESKPPSRDYLVMIVQIYNRGEIILRARLTLDGSYLPSLRQVGRLNAAFERSIWGKWSERARTETEKLTDNREIQPRRVYLLIPCNFACPRRILGLHSRVKFTKSFANSWKVTLFVSHIGRRFIANLPRTRLLFRLLIPILSSGQIENLSFELTGN